MTASFWIRTNSSWVKTTSIGLSDSGKESSTHLSPGLRNMRRKVTHFLLILHTHTQMQAPSPLFQIKWKTLWEIQRCVCVFTPTPHSLTQHRNFYSSDVRLRPQRVDLSDGLIHGHTRFYNNSTGHTCKAWAAMPESAARWRMYAFKNLPADKSSALITVRRRVIGTVNRNIKYKTLNL